jgi:hypothetical protein
MSNLKPSQFALLQAVAANDAGAPADQFDGRTAAALIKRGLLISLPRPDQSSLLTLTQEGRQAAGQQLAERHAAKASAPPDAEMISPATSKTAILRGLLERASGATVAEMSMAAGWLPHSVRGFLAGTLKKKLGLTVTSEKTDGERVYRIVSGAGA